MNLIEVNSSNISKVGYENNSLIVEYKSGALYKYKDFPKNLYENFLKAESKGKYMNSEVKGKFEFEKITDKKES